MSSLKNELTGVNETNRTVLAPQLKTCIARIRDWMASNRLKLNEDKTQLIWLGTCQLLDKITVQTPTLLNATVSFSTVVNDLGVLVDSQLLSLIHI